MRARIHLTAAAALMLAAPAFAQNAGTATGGTSDAPANKPAVMPAITIQHIRPQDQRGIPMFEAPKDDQVPFLGFRLDWGAAFTQQFQGLDHSNTAAPRIVNNVDQNKLMEIGDGFNNASANLNLNVQIASGIRVALTTYLSSRHHQEAWVKDGYLLIDESPIDVKPLNDLMKYVTVKAGHFEINYGDAHFRRSDNGNAMYNPFVGNLILDAFTTEVGGEIYVRKSGLLGMVGLTGGEIKGNILTPKDRSLALNLKAGFDRQITNDVRLRLTASNYRIEKSPANTLYGGDRAGSRYWYVLENTAATSNGQFLSGLINPGFRYKVNATMVNPYVEVKGLEVFGVYEVSKGRTAAETADREWKQFAIDGVYRFLQNDKLFAGARYNTAEGRLAGLNADVSVDRYQIGGGWFITPTVVLKAEYVNQKYNDFPTTDIRNGGKFKGFMVEGVVAF